MTDPLLIRGYDDLHQACRARADQLELSRAAIDKLAKLPEGYASKVLAPHPPRKLTLELLFFLLPALGYSMALVESASDLEQIRKIGGKRVKSNVRTSVAGMARMMAPFLHKLRQAGGRARMRSMTPEARSEFARQAVNARWRAYRKAKATRHYVGKPT